MYAGTTPTYRFKIPEKLKLNIEEIQDVWITFKGSITEFTKDIDDCSVYLNDDGLIVIEVGLSQEETFKIASDKLNVQIRVKMDDDKVYASKIFKEPYYQALKKEII